MYFNSFFLYPVSCTLNILYYPTLYSSYILYLCTKTCCISVTNVLYPVSCILYPYFLYTVSLYSVSCISELQYPVSCISVLLILFPRYRCAVSCILFPFSNFCIPIFCIQYLYYNFM